MSRTVPPDPNSPPARTTYRHGDLRRALIDAGLELARGGGPDAVGIREVTRRAGVVPNAAYRHFANRHELLQAVRSASLGAVARAMEAELESLGPARHDADYARASMRAVGSGYLRFALDETGLFKAAFTIPGKAAPADQPPGPQPSRPQSDPEMAGRSGLTPYELVGAALDRLVASGALPAERRPGAEFMTWSTVHGLAMLVIQGPLAALPRAQADAIGQRLFDLVEKGL